MHLLAANEPQVSRADAYIRRMILYVSRIRYRVTVIMVFQVYRLQILLVQHLAHTTSMIAG